ncbi:hypothetical protein BDV98DRAFT_576454, partial [Pterulicium gracile]
MEIKATRGAIEPSEDLAEFHSPFYDERARELLRWRSEQTYHMQLVHGDILPENLLADKDLRLTGLIDWECAAWMPGYWEALSSAKNGSHGRWGEVVNTLFSEYQQDVELHNSYVHYSQWCLMRSRFRRT